MFSRKQITILGICALCGFFLALLVLFFNARAANEFSFFSGTEKRSINSAVDAYFKSWENSDPAGMYKFISKADRELVGVSEYQEQFAEFPVRPGAHKTKAVSIVEPGRAKVLLLVDWPDFSTGKSIQREETFYLVKEGGAWKIEESISLEK